MTNKNNQKARHFAKSGIFLTGRKIIPPLPSIDKEAHRHSGVAIEFDAGANYGFGTGENDWLGAEAYVDPPR